VRFTWNTGAQSTAITAAVLDAPIGAPGTNDQHSVYGNLGAGSIRYDLREAWRNGVKDTLTNAVDSEWRHGNWTVNGSASYSTSRHIFKDTDDGFFGSNTFNGSALPLTGIGTGTASRQLISVNLLDVISPTPHDQILTRHTGATANGPEINWQESGHHDHRRRRLATGENERMHRRTPTPRQTRVFARRQSVSIRVGYDYNELFRNVQS